MQGRFVSVRKAAGVAVAAYLLAAFTLANTVASEAAGLKNQPSPSPEVTRTIQDATRDLLAGKIATARPTLFLVVEQNATADLTDLLKRAIGDDTTYRGLTATLDDAAAKAPSDTDRIFIQYNLARLYLLRARLLPSGPSRQGPLEAAANVTAQFPADLREPNAWELKGDIALERGDTNGAIAAYQRIASTGGSSASAQYRSALAYERVNRLPLAQRALEQAQRALLSQAGLNDTTPADVALRYNVAQELALVLSLENNDNVALAQLAQSARIRPDEAGGGSPAFTYRTDVARRLLQRGHAREVAAYADAALRAAPDDPDLQALRADARANRR